MKSGCFVGQWEALGGRYPPCPCLEPSPPPKSDTLNLYLWQSSGVQNGEQRKGRSGRIDVNFKKAKKQRCTCEQHPAVSPHFCFTHESLFVGWVLFIYLLVFFFLICFYTTNFYFFVFSIPVLLHCFLYYGQWCEYILHCLGKLYIYLYIVKWFKTLCHVLLEFSPSTQRPCPSECRGWFLLILVILNRVWHIHTHTHTHDAPCEGHTGRLITRSTSF